MKKIMLFYLFFICCAVHEIQPKQIPNEEQSKTFLRTLNIIRDLNFDDHNYKSAINQLNSYNFPQEIINRAFLESSAGQYQSGIEHFLSKLFENDPQPEINTIDDEGNNALMLAILSKSPQLKEVTEFVTNKGIDLEVKSKEGKTALQYLDEEIGVSNINDIKNIIKGGEFNAAVNANNKAKAEQIAPALSSDSLAKLIFDLAQREDKSQFLGAIRTKAEADAKKEAVNKTKVINMVDGTTPLMVAVNAGNTSGVKELLLFEAIEVNRLNNNKETALDLANKLNQNKDSIVKLLIDKGAQRGEQAKKQPADSTQNTELLNATKDTQLQSNAAKRRKILGLLSGYNFEKNTIDKALLSLVEKKDAGALSIAPLLRSLFANEPKPNVNIIDDQGCNIAMLAIKNDLYGIGDILSVLILISDFNLDVTDKFGKTLENYIEDIQEQKAKENAQQILYKAKFMRAVNANDTQSAKSIAPKLNAKILAQILYDISSIKNNAEFFEILRENTSEGTQKDAINSYPYGDKYTPLMQAISKKNIETIYALIKFAGLDLSIKNKQGKTVYDLVNSDINEPEKHKIIEALNKVLKPTPTGTSTTSPISIPVVDFKDLKNALSTLKTGFEELSKHLVP